MADDLPAFIEVGPGSFKPLWECTYDELAAYAARVVVVIGSHSQTSL